MLDKVTISKDRELLKKAMQQLMALTPCDALHKSTMDLIADIKKALAISSDDKEAI